MNKLDLLIARWKAGSITDPDLSLVCKALNDFRIERLKNEGQPKDQSGTSSVSGENNNPGAKRSKAKGL